MKQKKNSNLKRAAGPQKRPAAPAQADQTPRSRDDPARAAIAFVEEAAQEKGNPLSCAVFAASLRGRGADVHGVFSYCGF